LSNLISGYVVKELKTKFKEISGVHKLLAALFIIVKKWKSAKCPWADE
jgi:hypothetical protein